jgi:two-component system LytT family response regulator
MAGRNENSNPPGNPNLFVKIRALIVDDEPLARERVRVLLRDEPDVEIIGECQNGAEAVECTKRLIPDVLFLDVQMPEMDGFELLQNLPAENLPVVVFITAFDQHAVRAFDAHALDYLLKPFKSARFKEAVQRTRDRLAEKQSGTVARGLLELLAERSAANQMKKLAVKNEDKVLFVSVNDIDSIESAGNYVAVHVGKDNHILRETLTGLEAKLPSRQFMRISRAAIVNLERVKELQPMTRSESVIVLKNGRVITTTRSWREIQEKLENR